LLISNPTGAQLLQSNTLSDSLHPTLEAIEHVKGGFNIFRRFRITHLQKTECPEVLRHFWSGHAPKHVSERYLHRSQRGGHLPSHGIRQFRLDLWAEAIDVNEQGKR
jgi:hypothetical protein